MREKLITLTCVTVLAACVATTGCATITRGKHARVQINTMPSGATVWVDGQLRGQTPLTVSLRRDELHTVRFALAGHEEVTIQTDNAISAGHVLLDALFTGVIGIAVDAITGAWYNPGPAPLRVLLSPTGEDCAQDCAYLRQAGVRGQR